jgi:hypothetical protein
MFVLGPQRTLGREPFGPPAAAPPRRVGRKEKRQMRRELERRTPGAHQRPTAKRAGGRQADQGSPTVSVQAFRNVQPANPRPP